MTLTYLQMMPLFILKAGKSKSDVEPKLQTDGENSKIWAKNHKMKIRYDKTSCMALGTKHVTQTDTSNLNINIDGNTIKQVNKQKLLGVFIDETLSWSAHIRRLSLFNNFNKNISLKTTINLCPRESPKAILSRLYYH